MKTLIIAALVTVGIASTSLAQQRSVRDMATEMRAQYGQTFEACQSLASIQRLSSERRRRNRRPRGHDVHLGLHHGQADLKPRSCRSSCNRYEAYGARIMRAPYLT